MLILKNEWPLFLFTKSFSKAAEFLYLLGLDNSLFHRAQQKKKKKKFNMLGSERRHFSFSYLVFMFYCGKPGFDPCCGKTPWRRERLPTPVFWPREFHGLYSPWGCKESDTTNRLPLTLFPLLFQSPATLITFNVIDYF